MRTVFSTAVFVKLFTKFQGKSTHRSGTGARGTW